MKIEMSYSEAEAVVLALRLSRENYQRNLSSYPDDEFTLSRIEEINSLLNDISGLVKLYSAEEVEYIKVILEDTTYPQEQIKKIMNKIENNEELEHWQKDLVLLFLGQEQRRIIKDKNEGKYKVGYGNFESDLFVINKIIEKTKLGV